MSARKKILLCVSVFATMLLACLVGFIGFKPTKTSKPVADVVDTSVNNTSNAGGNVEKPKVYTYNLADVNVRKSNAVMNASYEPSINYTSQSGQVAYEYIFGNLMEHTTAVHLKGVQASGVNISYVYRDGPLEGEGEVTGDPEYSIQTIAPNAKKYIYVFVSPDPNSQQSSFSATLSWTYGKMATITINNNVESNEDPDTITIISGTSIEQPEAPAVASGYNFIGWYLDSNYTIPATFPMRSQGQTLYAKFPNLPESWLEKVGTNYHVKRGDTTDIPTDLIIPSTYKGTNVTKIIDATKDSEGVFYNMTLNSVTIPNTITDIGDYAFYGCSSKVELPNSLTDIGDYAFYGCTGLKGELDLSECANLISVGAHAFENATNITDVTIPGLDVCGDSAFAGCTGLNTAVVNLTTIQASCFSGCTNLSSVDIPNVIIIYDNAFKACQSLQEITIPSTMQDFGTDAFLDCFKLNTIINNSGYTFVSGSTDCGYIAYYAGVVLNNAVNDESKYITINGVEYYKESDSSYIAIGLSDNNKTDIVLDSRTTAIRQYAFKDTNVVNVDLSACSGLTTISQYAFNNCAKLQQVKFPTSLTTIGAYAFTDCRALYSITIPSKVTAIGANAFQNCYALAEVYNLSSLSIVKQVTSNGYVAYYAGVVNTSAVTPTRIVIQNDVVYFKNTNTDYTAVYLLDKLRTNVVLDGRTTKINQYSFINCDKLTTLTVPKCLKIVGRSAFQNCTNLTTINGFNESVIHTFDIEAFSGCKKLTGIQLPNTVTWLASMAFENCESLTEIKIPAGVTNLQHGCFASCYNLKTVDVSECINLTKVDNNAFYRSYNLEYIDLTNCTKLSYIGNNAFWASGAGTSQLKTVGDLSGKPITTIGAYAFTSCVNLTSINLANCTQLSSIGDQAFNGCSSLTGEIDLSASTSLTTISNRLFCGTGITGIKLPSTITKIATYAFSSTKLTSVILPASLQTLASWAFYQCANLQSADLSACTNLKLIDYGAFNGCTSLTEVNLADGLETIGTYSFASTTALATLTIPDSVKTIKLSAFDKSGLTSIALPSGLTAIENNAFDKCTKLILVDFSKCENLISIGNSAFIDCYSLVAVDMSDCTSLESLGVATFANCSTLETVALPSSLITIESQVFKNCTQLVSVDFAKCANLTSIGNTAFYNCTNLTSVDLSPCVGLTSIQEGTFRFCYSLEAVILPSSLKALELNAFGSCTSLDTINLNSCTYLISIEKGAFEGCSSLVSVDLRSCTSLTIIGVNSFKNCTNLTTVVLPSSLKQIGTSAFNGCTKLTSVTFDNMNDVEWYYTSNADYTDLEGVIFTVTTGGNYATLLNAGKALSKYLYCN